MKVVKKLFVLLLIIIINFSVLANITNVYAEDEANLNEQEIKENREIEDYENYSEAYKRYLSLSDEEKAKYTAIPRKYDVDIEEFLKEYEENKNDINSYKLASATMPSSYDLRSYIAISAEDQQRQAVDEILDFINKI